MAKKKKKLTKRQVQAARERRLFLSRTSKAGRKFHLTKKRAKKKKKKKKSGRKSLGPKKPLGWNADDHFDPKKVVKKICGYLKKAKSLYDINERLEAVHWGGIQDLTRNGTGMLSKGTRFSKSKRKKLKKKSKKKSMKRRKKKRTKKRRRRKR